MIKKNVTPASVTDVVEVQHGKSVTRGAFELPPQVARFAEEAGMDLYLPVEQRIRLVLDAGNRAISSMLEAGVWLISVRADTEHGEFERLLDGINLPARTAQRWMQQARFYVSLPEAERGKLLSLSGRKTMVLACANFEAAEALVLENTGETLQAANVAELMRMLEKKDAQVINLSMDLQQERARVTILNNKQKDTLQRQRNAPVEVEDLQDECLVAVRKAQQCLDILGKQAEAAGVLSGSWGEGARRHVLVSVQAVATEAAQLLAVLNDALGVDGHAPLPPTAMVDVHRAHEVRELYAQMTVSHETAARNRQIGRDKERQKGKGRPAQERPSLAIDK